MAELIFIEGVSGLGKSTLVRALAGRLRAAGRRVRAYVEFDAANPIDFYCTAYLPRREYAALAARYPELRAHAIDAGEAVLVRYYDGDTPLFAEPLRSELAARELCYHPPRPVPLAAYSAAYAAVWRDYAASLREAGEEMVLFDGSLLFHPLNDMTRNYAAPPEALAAHVRGLLAALGDVSWRVFYLRTDDYAAQLGRARRDRGQAPPTAEELRFWTDRAESDRRVLAEIGGNIEICDVSGGRWEAATEEVLAAILNEKRGS